jgi:heme-degrading monooxygenase HmoA
MSSGGKTMHARAMTGQVKPEKLSDADSAIRTYQDSIVLAARQQKGFKGALLLTNAHTGKAISITLWETESDMMESEANDYYQEQIEKIAWVLAGPGMVDHYLVSVQADRQSE